MTDKEIIQLWKSSLSKDILARIYRRKYNQQIKVIRADPRNRNAGRFISNYESLAYIEKAIYKYLKERQKKDEYYRYSVSNFYRRSWNRNNGSYNSIGIYINKNI